MNVIYVEKFSLSCIDPSIMKSWLSSFFIMKGEKLMFSEIHDKSK